MTQQCLPKPIVITPARERVKVIFNGEVIADSVNALDLDEPGAPLRTYIPRQDVSIAVLTDSLLHTTCPYKGVASYHALDDGKASAKDAVWYYPHPCALVEPIRDHLAFWGNAITYERHPA